jgi:AcrR family transcriptional regulator
MRITADDKTATRERILEAALQAFRTRGFESTTTRDIAAAAGIATGTLFNYFAAKEAIIEHLAAQALAKARSKFAQQEGAGDLEEELFSHVAAELRQLRPLRKFVTPLLETSLCPLAAADRSEAQHTFRAEHLDTVQRISQKHGFAELSPISLQVYWSLYIGVLAFWASDKSPKQEDTLALLDQSIGMFVAWLSNENERAKK